MDPNKIRKYLIFSLCIILLIGGLAIVIEKNISHIFNIPVPGATDPLGNVDSGRIDSSIAGAGDSIDVIETGIDEGRNELRAVGDHITEGRKSVAASRESLETGRSGVGDIRAGLDRLEGANEKLRAVILRLQSPCE